MLGNQTVPGFESDSRFPPHLCNGNLKSNLGAGGAWELVALLGFAPPTPAANADSPFGDLVLEVCSTSKAWGG